MKSPEEIRRLRDDLQSVCLTEEECQSLPLIDAFMQCANRAVVDHLSWTVDDPPMFADVDRNIARLRAEIERLKTNP